MKAYRWRRSVCWGVCGVLAGVALLWSWLQNLYGPATAFIVSIATNNETYVLIFALVMVSIAVSSRRREQSERLPVQAPDPQTGAGDLAKILSPNEAAFHEKLSVVEAQIRDIYERLNDTATKEAVEGDKNGVIGLLGEIQKFLLAEIKTLDKKVTAENESTKGRLDNQEQAWLGQLSQIRRETKHFSGKIDVDDIDLKHLLFFAVLQANVAYLEGLISEVPSEAIPLGDNVDKNHREGCLILHRRWAEHVLNGLAGTRCGAGARSVAANAETEAVTKMRATPESELPKHIHPIELREYEIANLKTLRLSVFLDHELAVTIGEMRGQRDDLIRQQAKRSPEPRG